MKTIKALKMDLFKTCTAVAFTTNRGTLYYQLKLLQEQSLRLQKKIEKWTKQIGTEEDEGLLINGEDKLEIQEFFRNLALPVTNGNHCSKIPEVNSYNNKNMIHPLSAGLVNTVGVGQPKRKLGMSDGPLGSEISVISLEDEDDIDESFMKKKFKIENRENGVLDSSLKFTCKNTSTPQDGVMNIGGVSNASPIQSTGIKFGGASPIQPVGIKFGGINNVNPVQPIGIKFGGSVSPSLIQPKVVKVGVGNNVSPLLQARAMKFGGKNGDNPFEDCHKAHISNGDNSFGFQIDELDFSNDSFSGKSFADTPKKSDYSNPSDIFVYAGSHGELVDGIDDKIELDNELDNYMKNRGKGEKSIVNGNSPFERPNNIKRNSKVDRPDSMKKKSKEEVENVPDEDDLDKELEEYMRNRGKVQENSITSCESVKASPGIDNVYIPEPGEEVLFASKHKRISYFLDNTQIKLPILPNANQVIRFLGKSRVNLIGPHDLFNTIKGKGCSREKFLRAAFNIRTFSTPYKAGEPPKIRCLELVGYRIDLISAQYCIQEWICQEARKDEWLAKEKEYRKRDKVKYPKDVTRMLNMVPNEVKDSLEYCHYCWNNRHQTTQCPF